MAELTTPQVINVGTTPGDGTGDTGRDGAIKINDNFSEVYAHDHDSAYVLKAGDTMTGPLVQDNTTGSTSPTTGSIQTDGGLGVAENVFIGEDLDVAGHVAIGASASVSADSTLVIADSIATAGFGTKYAGISATIEGTGSVQFGGEVTGLAFYPTLNITSGLGLNKLYGIANRPTIAATQSTSINLAVGVVSSLFNNSAVAPSVFSCFQTLAPIGKVGTSIGVDVGTAGSPNVTDAVGINISKQQGATGTNRGLVLRGDGAGADIVFGASYDANIYFDGADNDLVIKPNLVTSTSRLVVDGGLKTNSGRIKKTRRITATDTILTTDDVVFCNTATAYTVTLPTGAEGQTLRIINSGTSGNTLTVKPFAGQDLIGIADNSFLLYDGESLEITYNATDGWY